MSIKIDISKLLASFPVADFVDSISLPLKYRPRRVGHFVEKFITVEKFTTIDKTYPQQQLIRAISWDKYKCSLIVHEGQNIENIDIAGSVNITTDDGSQHTANVLEFGEPVNIAGTDHRQIDFTYYDTNLLNYLSVPVNDFLNQDALPQLHTLADLNTLKFGTRTYYTSLNHKVKVPKLEQKSEMIDGVEKVIKSNYQNTIVARFYTNEAEAAYLAAHLPLLGQYGVSSITYRDTANEKNYAAIERIIPIIKEVDHDLYQVDIELKHFNARINHY